MMTFNRILIVCIGNVCRSPIAEHLLKAKLSALPGLDVESAGLSALAGRPADPHVLSVLRNNGVDASEHRARQLDPGMLVHSNLVLTMDAELLSRLNRIAPQIRGRAFLIGKWQNDRPIPDPFRQQRAAFEHVFELIDRATDDWMPYLIRPVQKFQKQAVNL